jgi:hypothetical protein
VARRIHDAARRRRDDVAGRAQWRHRAGRPVRAGTPHGDVPGRIPEPADQPAPRLRHDPSADATRGRRTRIECAWAFAGAVDPAYAVDFWDLTNRQDWAACESVQRGLRSPYAVPGPLAPAEDGVHQFVQRVARAYLR